MNQHDRISRNPEILSGKPVIAGTRIPVELILGWLANGWTHEMILDSYPALFCEDILAALAFAAEMLREEAYVAMNKAAAPR